MTFTFSSSMKRRQYSSWLISCLSSRVWLSLDLAVSKTVTSSGSLSEWKVERCFSEPQNASLPSTGQMCAGGHEECEAKSRSIRRAPSLKLGRTA